MWAILVAAGKGQRMGAATPKQYLTVAGKTLLEHSLDILDRSQRVEGIVLVLAGDDSHWPTLSPELTKPLQVTTGGAERADSVMAGLRALQLHCKADDWVLVHDAARICVRPADIDAMEAALLGHACGGLLGMPLRDTLKQAAAGESVTTLDRNQLWQAQTPQIFRYGLLSEAMAAAREEAVVVTDEAMALERRGYRPKLIEGRADNIKITLPEDLLLAEFILSRQAGEQ